MTIKLIVGFAFALIWLFLLFRFRKKHNGQVVLWLMLGIEVLVLSLIFWPGKPMLPVGRVVVLTQDSPDSLAKQEGAVKLLPNAEGYTQWIQLSKDSNQRISLYGNGLPADWLERTTPGQLAYYPNEKVSGITRLQLPASVSLGDTLRLPVWVRAGKPSSLSLLHKDSIIWQARLNSDSLLWPGHLPAYEGLQHYKLIFQQADTVNFYVSVKESKRLTLALFTAYPNPEQKFLTDWLKKEGHRVYTESNLRPGQAFSKAIGKESPDNLNEAISKADIFFFDQERYEKLSRKQKNQLRTAVQEGKSVIFWPSAGKALAENKGVAVTGTRQSLKESGGQPLPAVQLPADAAGEVLFTWANQSPAAIRQADGFGRRAWLGIQQSYIWQLQGNTTAYNSFWRNLLRQLSPPEVKPSLHITSWPNRINRAVLLSLQQKGLPEPGWLYAPSGDSLQLSFVESRPHTGNWQATAWPKESGTYRWQQSEHTLYFEVSPPTAFPATYQQASLPFLNKDDRKPMKRAATTGLPGWKLLLVVALVASLTGTWAIEKFRH